MRKVTFGGAPSLDNYFARKNDAVDWLMWSKEAYLKETKEDLRSHLEEHPFLTTMDADWDCCSERCRANQ